ncbi:MAG TPA: glycosyltransferase family 2 protein [Phycisphaerae bacterium]|nr:glycosyltransferase family 2 protein [Phycisphaerae bacterium]HNU45833.1 glycosyltransferase family 2 protein [Phycisphaerae bacterium]
MMVLILWSVLAGLAALLGLLRWRVVYHTRARRRVLSAACHPQPPLPPPAVSIIVAARNEERDIETCVRSLLAQQYPDYEVIVVDDRSTDRTPLLLRTLAEASRGRLKVITVTDLPPGWFGKCNALREGVAVARGDWVLLTDADCRHESPLTLRAAVGEALHSKADLLTMTPPFRMPTLWERLIQPVCVMTLMTWFRPTRVNNPNRATAFANGMFTLIRRPLLETLLRDGRMRNVLNEDIRMARLAKETGYRLRVVEGVDLYTTRMYGTFGRAWRGWSRLFCGCLETVPRLLVTLLMLVVYGVLPLIGLLTALGGAWRAGEGRSQWWWLGLAAGWLLLWAGQALVDGPVYRSLGAPARWAWGFPLGAAVTMGMVLHALLQVLGLAGTTWRGTTYRRGAVQPAADAPCAPEAVSCTPATQSPAFRVSDRGGGVFTRDRSRG